MGIKDFFTSNDPDSSTLWTTPWTWRDDAGLYVAPKGQVWLYRKMPVDPIDPHWEDVPARLALGQRLERLLVDLGGTSKESPLAIRQMGTNREVHIVSITWRQEAHAPKGSAPRLREYLDETLGFLVPTKALFVGVRLWQSGESKEATSLLAQLKATATSALLESTPDIDRYSNDLRVVEDILGRYDARVPDAAELRQLESWYNLGRGPDALIVEDRRHLRIDDISRIEAAAVVRFNQRINVAPHFQWLADAEAHENGAHVISVRAELEPANAARQRARQSQRRIRSMLEEEAETGDIDRPEFTDTFAAAQAIEEHFIGSDEPLMTRCSILMFRRADDVDESYINMLKNNHQIDVRPLDHRQLLALDESLPCSTKRANPFPQDVSVAMLAYAGMHGFSALGDSKGVYLGLTHPNLTPAYLDLLRSGGENKPPITGVFGEPGSGKAQPLDAKILTPTGWVRMGDIHVGDEVIGSDGQPTKVLGVYPQGDRPIVRVVFNDGSSTECDTEHYWVTTPDGPGKANRRWQWQTAEGIAAVLDDGQTNRNVKGTVRRIRIPVVAPVKHHSAAPLPLDPYLLGVLLGDGGLRARTPTVTTVDPEILEAVARLVPEGIVPVPEGAITWRLSRRKDDRLAKLVADLGWAGVSMYDRRLPVTLDAETARGVLLGVADHAPRTAEGHLSLASEPIASQIEALASRTGVAVERVASRGGRVWIRIDDLGRPDSTTATEKLRAGYLTGLFLVRGRTMNAGLGLRPCTHNAPTCLLPDWVRVDGTGRTLITTGSAAPNALTAALVELDLMGKGSWEKHIPASYLFAPVEAREALLQGLLDTDGGVACASKPGSIEYTTTSEQLGADVVALVQSLGGTAGVAQRETSYLTPDGTRRMCRDAWRLTIRLPESVEPFRLPRKSSGFTRGVRNRPDRWVVAVEDVGIKPAQCIRVEADDHIYVTDNYICTRNTWLCSSIATQAAFSGLPVIFINPKSGGIGSSISGIVDYAGGERISLSELSSSRGAFDPFRYAEPERAADLLTAHITSSLRELSESDQLDVAHGIRTAVRGGARCGKDALRGIDNPRVLQLIAKLITSNPMFALAFAMTPSAEMGVGEGITLVEFDRPLPLPDPNQAAGLHSTEERVALSTITLVTRASIQMLANAGGGVLIVDEAWTFLNHPAGRAELDRLGREGRSLNVLAIFATQRVADLLNHDMASFMSRVFVMKLTDEKEANAAFEIVGLEPTASRRAWLAQAGPQPADPETGKAARWAMTLHRDLNGRHSALLVGPTAPGAAAAWTTNPEDRRRAAEKRRNELGPAPDGGNAG